MLIYRSLYYYFIIHKSCPTARISWCYSHWWTFPSVSYKSPVLLSTVSDFTSLEFCFSIIHNGLIILVIGWVTASVKLECKYKPVLQQIFRKSNKRCTYNLKKWFLCMLVSVNIFLFPDGLSKSLVSLEIKSGDLISLSMIAWVCLRVCVWHRAHASAISHLVYVNKLS